MKREEGEERSARCWSKKGESKGGTRAEANELKKKNSPLVELLESHLIGQQRPPELSLVVDEGNLSDGLVVGGLGSELLGDGVGGVLELLEELGGDGEVVNSGEGSDLSEVSETGGRGGED